MSVQPIHCRVVPIRRRAFALISLLSGLAVILPDASLHAASPDRVTQSVDSSQRVALPGHLAAWAQSKRDGGDVDADATLGGLSITLNRTVERQQAFDEFLREQKDPSSPNFRHWLSPTEVGERFGASQNDIEAVSAWLRSQGLSVDDVANSRLRIRFSGTAAGVAAAFATELRYFEVGTAKRMANASSPQVPAALADAIASVQGLQTIRYEPLLRTRAAQPSVYPAATSCQGTVCNYAIFPADFAKIYDIGAVHQQGIDGSGQTIAVVGRARVYAADMQNFQSLAGLPNTVPTVTIPTGGIDPGAPTSTPCSDTGTPSCTHPSAAVVDQGEATLDVQRASSVAPGAAINLIVSGTLNDNSPDGVQLATEYAIEHDPVPAKILSISFTSCEDGNGADVASSLDGLFAQAEMEGISVFVASGDGGVAGCASLDATPTGTEVISTNVLCSSGHVTCVGGTEFADSAHPSAYWSATTGADYLSALGYIPEGAWNDPLDSNDKPQFSATGGGVSAYIAKPSWQVGTGVPGNAGRYTPDVSFSASPREGYFTCYAAQGGSCVVSGGQFSFLPSGGTSATAPSMAGITALLNQKTGTAQGNLNPGLYALAAGSNGVFHDASVASVTGPNSGITNCVLSTPSLCNNSTPGTTGLSGGLQGYAIGTGYDLATGLGSLDVANFLAQWGSASATVNLDQYGLTGAWTIAGASGQGLSISVLPDYFGAGSGQLFTGWFTYDVTAAGGMRWYTLQGQVEANSPSATVPIYLTEGGSFDSSRPVTTTEVGSASLQFSDCEHGTLDFSFSAGTPGAGSLQLSRGFPNVNCTPQGTTSTTATDYLLSGVWAVDGESGQGLTMEVSPTMSTFFGCWYTYTAGTLQGGTADQRWFTLQAPWTTHQRQLQTPIYATSGGAFNADTTTQTDAVGSGTLSFSSCTSATFVYAFNAGANAGHAGTLHLTRLDTPPAGCTF